MLCTHLTGGAPKTSAPHAALIPPAHALVSSNAAPSRCGVDGTPPCDALAAQHRNHCDSNLPPPRRYTVFSLSFKCVCDPPPAAACVCICLRGVMAPRDGRKLRGEAISPFTRLGPRTTIVIRDEICGDGYRGGEAWIVRRGSDVEWRGGWMLEWRWDPGSDCIHLAGDSILLSICADKCSRFRFPGLYSGLASRVAPSFLSNARGYVSGSGAAFLMPLARFSHRGDLPTLLSPVSPPPPRACSGRYGLTRIWSMWRVSEAGTPRCLATAQLQVSDDDKRREGGRGMVHAYWDRYDNRRQPDVSSDLCTYYMHRSVFDVCLRRPCL
ncbi:hypothetical protein B0H11DRAFT_227526 [Mycena galericulata]|nr:hypothetical protein B0H11DRAFT_227526 [Mycena galericulata]